MVGEERLGFYVVMSLIVAAVMVIPVPFSGSALQSGNDAVCNGSLVGDELFLGGHTFAIHGDLDDRALYMDGAQMDLAGIVPWWVSGLVADGEIHLVIGDAAYRTYLSQYLMSPDDGNTWDFAEPFWGFLKPRIGTADGAMYVTFERSMNGEEATCYLHTDTGFEGVRQIPPLHYADVLDYRVTSEYLMYDEARKKEFTDTPAKDLTSESGRAEAKEWAYIYVCNGEASGIESYLEADATEMAAGGSSANHWAICLFDDNGAGTNQVRVMNVGGGGYTSYTMAQVGLPSEPDLNSPSTFITFLDWCFDNYPGNKVVWDNGGHGGGVDGAMYDETPSSGVIDLVEITTIADSLVTALGRPIDVVAWDLCLMMTQEWLYGYKPITPFSVASMNTIVGAGFNYQSLMNYLAANNPTPLLMAHKIAEDYWTGESAYISVVDMDNWDYTMMPTFNNLCQELRHGSYLTQINTAFTNAWYPYTSGYCHDMWEWMANINSGISNPTVQALALQVRDQTWTANYPSGLNDAVLMEYGSNTRHHGLGDEKVANTAWKIDIETIRNEMITTSGVSNTIPTCTVTSPSEGADIPMDGIFTIQGTASDSVSVSRVEVKINREWWTVATGTNSWSFSWDVTSDSAYYGLGAYKVWARSYDGTDYSNYQCINVNVIESYGSAGTVTLDKATYLLEDTALVTVTDGDLTAPSITVNVRSTAEPAGETVTLLATTPQGKYEGSVPISATNSAGVLMVAHGNTITATYNDANDGSGPATVTDTASVDGQVGATSGLAVEWTGTSSATLISQDFSSTTFPPTGWSTYTSGTTGTWSRQTTANAGGVSPEARFYYGNSGTGVSVLYAGPFNTAGMTSISLQWQNMINDYTGGTGVQCRLQTSTNANTWTDAGYLWDDTVNPGSQSAALIQNTVTVNVGSPTLYIGWAVTGNSYQLNYWYIDSILCTYTGGATTDDNLLTWTLSADDGAGANDVSHYNIYRATGASGPWDSGAIIDTVPAGTATYTDHGRGEIDGINWWYVVRAEDIWGNLDTNTNAVPEEGGSTIEYSIDLAGKSAGTWVFVSFPIDVSGNIQTILNDATLGDAGTAWTMAKWYNPQTPADPWKTYRVGGTANDLAAINNAMGVWLWITANGGDQDLTVAVEGNYPASAATVNLYAGWNLVGYPSATGRAESTTLPAQADYVAVWQAASPYISQHAKGSSTMSHGNAYWVHVTADCTWVVNP